MINLVYEKNLGLTSANEITGLQSVLVPLGVEKSRMEAAAVDLKAALEADPLTVLKRRRNYIRAKPSQLQKNPHTDNVYVQFMPAT